MFIKIVHLQLFNVKYKFIHSQLFDVKFLFFEKHIFCKQKKTAAYRRVSLFWILNLLRKMMTCYIWGADKFLRHCILCMSILKCVFGSKRYRTNTVRTLWGTWSASALHYLGVDHFGRSRTKIYRKQEKL